eukprot:scaffold85232_cov21-Tisochrysis_lutea.AAC.2
MQCRSSADVKGLPVSMGECASFTRDNTSEAVEWVVSSDMLTLDFRTSLLWGRIGLGETPLLGLNTFK